MFFGVREVYCILKVYKSIGGKAIDIVQDYRRLFLWIITIKCYFIGVFCPSCDYPLSSRKTKLRFPLPTVMI